MAGIEFVTAPVPEDAIAPASVTESEPGESPGSLGCVVCGKTLVYGGRGPRPKYCEDHKRSTARTPTTSGRTSKDERIRKELTATLGMIGLGLMAVDQYDGLVVMDRSADTVNALMVVAENNPRVRKVLEQMLEVSVWAALGVALAGIAVPIGVHHGVIPLPAELVERQFLSPETRETLARIDKRKASPERNTVRPTVVPDTDVTPGERSEYPRAASMGDPTTW